MVILAIEDTIDKFYVLTELKRAFASGGYNAYTIGMEPECVLYALEYMPEPVSDINAWKNFVESQVFINKGIWSYGVFHWKRRINFYMFILIVMCKSIFTMREIIILYGSLLREKRLRKNTGTD